MNLFTIDPGLGIWTWVSFGIMFAIMAKFILPMILRNMQNRETLIHTAVDKAQEIERRLAALEEERQSVLRQANQEADELLRRTRLQAEQLQRELAAKAEAEAQAILVQGRQRLQEERAAALETLQEELADFVCASAEKVVGTSFTSTQDRAWAREMARSL